MLSLCPSLGVPEPQPFSQEFTMPTRRNTLRLLVGLPAFCAAPLMPAFAGGTTRAPAIHDVAIKVFQFQPRQIEIRVGDTVRWTNQDGIEHSATADTMAEDGTRLFDTGLFERDEMREITFTEAGSLDYHCSRHPSMKGLVVVLP
jgi:plastocyanin